MHCRLSMPNGGWFRSEKAKAAKGALRAIEQRLDDVTHGRSAHDLEHLKGTIRLHRSVTCSSPSRWAVSPSTMTAMNSLDQIHGTWGWSFATTWRSTKGVGAAASGPDLSYTGYRLTRDSQHQRARARTTAGIAPGGSAGDPRDILKET